MIFSSLEFVVFFLLTLIGLVLLRGRHTARKALLLMASYYFYAYWDWRFLSLIIFSTLVDYVVGLGLEQAESSRFRRGLIGLSLVTNLGLLCFFKYFNFFIDSAQPILQALGLNSGALDIILPVGISFYTFQTLSYSLDVYRRQLNATHSLLDFALFVGFFPQLVAGPIVRASHFLPQLAEYKPLTSPNFYLGFQRFCYGLFKKVFLADRLALYVDNVFANAGAYDWGTTWLAVVAYAMQIYFDFSGYSDMAIGTARILGYDLGENFDFPYRSKSPREFWRRWHISLSTWMRDYVYIPLGGNRGTAVRTAGNALLTMLLCGLWHGAAWTFVVWGGLHGLAMILERATGQHWNKLPMPVVWAGTMLFVLAGWVVFRAEGFGQAMLMYRQMFLPHQGISWVYPFVPVVLVGTMVMHLLDAQGVWSRWFLPQQARWYTPTLLFGLLLITIAFRPAGFAPFIYFQF